MSGELKFFLVLRHCVEVDVVTWTCRESKSFPLSFNFCLLTCATCCPTSCDCLLESTKGLLESDWNIKKTSWHLRKLGLFNFRSTSTNNTSIRNRKDFCLNKFIIFFGLFYPLLDISIYFFLPIYLLIGTTVMCGLWPTQRSSSIISLLWPSFSSWIYLFTAGLLALDLFTLFLAALHTCCYLALS